MNFHSIINFGKYKDTPKELYFILGGDDRNYLIWCLLNLEYFALEPYIIDDIIKMNGNNNYERDRLIKINEDKIDSYYKCIENNYYQSERTFRDFENDSIWALTGEYPEDDY